MQDIIRFEITELVKDVNKNDYHDICKKTENLLYCIYRVTSEDLENLSVLYRLIFYAYHINDSDYWTYFLYVGMFGLLIATIWNYKRNKMNGTCDTCTTYNGKTVETQSTLTCPDCGHKKTEIMPTDACVYFYECEKCKTRLKPLQGDCCVYCSYGTVKCPPIQAGENCC